MNLFDKFNKPESTSQEKHQDIERSAFQKLMQESNQCFPVCVPSYKRWNRKDNHTLVKLIEHCNQDIQAQTYVFVRKEQYSQYLESFPKMNLVQLPEVHGLAGTRQYIVDFVNHDLKVPYFIDMDDDITSVKYVWFNNNKYGLSKLGESDPSEIFQFSCALSKMAFEKYDCVLGHLLRYSRFSASYLGSQTAFVLNRGASPRQFTFVAAKKLEEKGIRRNLDFDETGDDVGLVAEIAEKQGNMFRIPCLVYDTIDEKLNSVIRNDSNRKRLAQYEHDLILKKYSMKDYYRVNYRFEDGSVKATDIDFKKYTKKYNIPYGRIFLDEFIEWRKK